MPTPHRLPVSLRIRRARHRTRRSERPARRPPRLRHPHGLRVWNHGQSRREIAERGGRSAGIVRVHVRADPVDLVNYGSPVAPLPYVGRVHVPEWPAHPGRLHGRPRFANVGKDHGGAGAGPGWLPIQIFAADGYPDHQAIELRIIFHGCSKRVQLIRDYCLARGTPDPEK